MFPSRIWFRALSITLLINSYHEVSASLTVRRIVPPGAEIVRLGNADDIAGMKRLFNLGVASPNESFENGGSLLKVRTSFMCRTKLINVLL